MGAVILLSQRRYELMYQQFYANGKLNLRLDEVNKKDAANYIANIQHRDHMRNVLKVI